MLGVRLANMTAVRSSHQTPFIIFNIDSFLVVLQKHRAEHTVIISLLNLKW